MAEKAFPEQPDVSQDANDMEETLDTKTFLRKCFAEAFGTGLIVLFGVGSVNTAVLTGAQAGIWQVAVVWGIGIALAIILTGPVSGAHLNPAVSLAFAIFRPNEFPRSLLLPYIVSQLLGAVVFAFINYLIFSKPILAFHRVQGIQNFDEEEAVLSAMVFGEYYPNPAFLSNPLLGWDKNTVNMGNSFFIEALGTFLLVLVIFSVTSKRNKGVSGYAAPLIIGFTVSAMISLWAPLNQAGFNPARDFGPRIAAFFIGYRDIALPGPELEAISYIVGPLIGGALGGLFFEIILEPGYPSNE